MGATAMAVTDTARGPLMPRPTTAMAVTATARGPLMPRPTTVPATAMAVMAVATDTDTARGPLMPTTAVDTATAVMAMEVTDTASKLSKAYFLRISTSFHELNQIQIYSFERV